MLKPTVVGLSLAAATSVVNVVMDICRKKALNENDLISTTFWLRAFAALGLACAFVLRLHSSSGLLIHDSGPVFGYFGPQWPVLVKFGIYLVIGTGLIASVQFFYLSALQSSDISLSVPFMSFTPVLLVPAGYLFLHEIPTQRQLLGVILVVCGSLAMNRDALRFGLLGPFWAILRQKGSRYMLICAVLLAISNPVDKIIVLMSDPVTYGLCYGAMLCIIFALAMFVTGRNRIGTLRHALGWIVVAGLLDAAVVLLQFAAYGHLQVLLTVTIKRAGLILSVFAGGVIFREKQIRDRLVAASTMLCGIIFIYVPISRFEQLIIATVILSLLLLWLRITPRLQTATGTPTTEVVDRGLAEVQEQMLTSASSAAEQGLYVTRQVGEHRRPVLGCAILGCGEIAQKYLGVYRNLALVQVTACIDVVESRARAAAEYLSGCDRQSIPIRTSVMLADALRDDVDIVVISTPNHLHRVHAVAALSSGKHIFIQKPLANSVSEGLKIVQTARRHPTTAGMYMSYFDQPILHDFREMAMAGGFGTITQIHMKVMHPGGLLWSRQADEGNCSWRGSVEKTGGGAFIQLAVHCVRTISWILSEQVTHVQGFAANRMCPGLEGEDSAVAVLRFHSGTYATLNVSWCATGEELAIHGSKGSVTYRDNHLITVQSSHDYDGIALHYKSPQEATFDCPAPALDEELQRFNQHRMFLEAVRNGTEPYVTLEDGLQDLAVVSAFYESVRTGNCVAVESIGQLLEMERHTARRS